MDFKNLSEEAKKKIAGCKTPEDYMAVAKELGYELTDEQLEKIGGGQEVSGWMDPPKCPKCGSKNVDMVFNTQYECFEYHCKDCGYKW